MLRAGGGGLAGSSLCVWSSPKKVKEMEGKKINDTLNTQEHRGMHQNGSPRPLWRGSLCAGGVCLVGV